MGLKVPPIIPTFFIRYFLCLFFRQYYFLFLPGFLIKHYLPADYLDHLGFCSFRKNTGNRINILQAVFKNIYLNQFLASRASATPSVISVVLIFQSDISGPFSWPG